MGAGTLSVVYRAKGSGTLPIAHRTAWGQALCRLRTGLHGVRHFAGYVQGHMGSAPSASQGTYYRTCDRGLTPY